MSFASRLFKKVGGQRDHDANTYYPPPPVSPYPNYSPPPASPYQPFAPAQFVPPPPPPPPPTASPSARPSPPPLPSRQQSNPQRLTPVNSYTSQSLQPYNAPAQQGFLHSPPPLPLSRQPSPSRQLSPLPRPTSPFPQQSAVSQTLPESQSLGGPPRQRSARRDPPSTRKILSLDGGGVRGLSIITILKCIMRNLNQERGYDLEPWEEFDMIGGTSTGGIIAIMLGRLRMSLDECQAAYTQLSETIFTLALDPKDPRRLYRYLKASGKFEHAPLEGSIKSTIQSKQLHEDVLFKEKDPDACKVFVCATHGEDGSLAILRSYQSRRHDPLYEICKIWEAARATSAASTFFEPVQIGPNRQLFVDGALTGSNNPIRTAHVEARDVWPTADRLILSVGTGAAPGQAVTGNLLELANRLKDMVTDSEKTNRSFRMDNNEMVRNGRLYRFNVMLGLANIGLEEHEAIGRIATYTDTYLDDPDVFDAVQSCVDNLCRGGQRMGYASAEELESLMTSMQLSHVFVCICANCLQGIRFGEASYFCIDCSVDFCPSCQSSHAVTEHAGSLVKITNHSWPPRPDVAMAEASCSECSLETRCRLECSDCQQCICSACLGVPLRRQTWLRHRDQHPRPRGFICILSSLQNVVPPASHNCECLTVTGCVGHCERCYNVIKVGEAIYMCRTCKLEYSASAEICADCCATESPKHRGHEYVSLTLQRVTDRPDDRLTQIKDWWRCSYPGCNMISGPSIEWLHKHPEARLCLGDALIDFCRENAGRECTKTFSYRSRLTEPPNATEKMKCIVCLKSIAYNVWNRWCNTCDIAICHTCTNTGRDAHRHRTMVWMRVVKVDLTTAASGNNGLIRYCDRCGQQYLPRQFNGFECTTCRQYHCCLGCVQKSIFPQHAVCVGKPAAFDLLIVKA